MSKYRRKAKVDKNQSEIVTLLRTMPDVTVAVSHDDILVGVRGLTLWYEIKSDLAVSRRSGKVLETKVKETQKKIRAEWKGHYKIVSSYNEIYADIIKNVS